MNGRFWHGQCRSGRACWGGGKKYMLSEGYQNIWYDDGV